MRLVIGEALQYVTGVYSAKASYTMGKIAQLGVTVPLVGLPLGKLRREKAWLYRDAQLLFVGQIMETPSVVLDGDGEEEVSLVIRDLMSLLACYHAKVADGHYQNLDVVTQIVPFLLIGTGWGVDASAVPSFSTVTTLDTRTAKNRWEQIEKAVKAVPQIGARIDTQVDEMVLEVGEFVDVTVRVGADNLTAFSYDVTDMDAFGYVVAYGGKTSNEPLTLYNGGANPHYLASSFYPRYEIVRYESEWAVRDTEALVGCGQTVTFSNVKTKNDVEVPIGSPLWLEAQWALIQSAVRWLQQHKPDYVVYTMKALLFKLPRIGDWAHLQLRREELVRDPFGNAIMGTGIDIDENVKITKVEVDYSSEMILDDGRGNRRLAYEYGLTCSGSGYADPNSGDEIHEDFDSALAFDNPTGAQISTVIQNIPFNDTMVSSVECLPLVARRFAPAVPSIPGGAQGVVIFGQVLDSTGTVAYMGAEIASEVIPLLVDLSNGIGYVACVQIGGGWNAPFDDGIFRVTYVFQL